MQQHIKHMVKYTSCIPKQGQESGDGCRSTVPVDVVGREVGNGARHRLRVLQASPQGQPAAHSLHRGRLGTAPGDESHTSAEPRQILGLGR